MVTAQDMITAVTDGDLARVKELLAADPSLASARNDNGDSAILLAVYRGRQAIADALLAGGASLDVFEASAVGYAGRIHTLLQDDPSLVNSYAHDGWTPLHLAAFFGRRAAAEVLLDNGADLHARSRNSTDNTPLHAATAAGRRELVELLLARGADPNSQGAGWTPLHLTADNGDVAIAEMLLGSGADVNARSNDGRTPLGMALQRGHKDMIDLLSQHGGAE